MTAPSPVPRRIRSPRWLDLRLILGIALVAACVVIGSVVVAQADSTSRMWAASRDLAVGTVLQPEDIHLVPVRLPRGSGSYVAASQSLVGRSVARNLTAGELVPRAAIGDTEAATRLTMSFADADAPKLARGQRVEVWLSTKACPQVVLLADVAVQDVASSGGSAFSNGSGQTVVIRVPSSLAARVITALAFGGAVVRAGILDGPPAATDPAGLPSLDHCGDS